MKKVEVRNNFVTRLEEALSSHGFRFVKSQKAFVRRIANGSQKLFLSIVDYNPEYIVSLTTGIRLDAVEDIFNQFSGADAKGSKLTMTTLTQLEYFAGAPSGTYSVSNEEQIRNASEDMLLRIDETIIPFLDKYQDVASVDDAVNSKQISDFDSTMLANRAMHSLILAFLNGNKRYSMLVEEYRVALAQHTPFDRERFENLVNFLDEGLARIG